MPVAWFQGFIKIYKQFFPHGDPSKFASLVFRVFDENSVSIMQCNLSPTIHLLFAFVYVNCERSILSFKSLEAVVIFFFFNIIDSSHNIIDRARRFNVKWLKKQKWLNRFGSCMWLVYLFINRVVQIKLCRYFDELYFIHLWKKLLTELLKRIDIKNFTSDEHKYEELLNNFNLFWRTKWICWIKIYNRYIFDKAINVKFLNWKFGYFICNNLI